MPQGRPWFKKYAADWVQGCIGIGAAEWGVYDCVCTLIYDRGGPIPNDHDWLGRILGEDKATTRRLISALIKRGKLFKTDDGKLMNQRAEIELELAEKTAQKLSLAGQKGGRPSRKNKDLAKANQKPTEAEQNRGRGRAEPKGRARRKISVDAKTALGIWNAGARRAGLRDVKTLSKARRAALEQALGLIGGTAEDFEALVNRVTNSAFLTGNGRRQFFATFDFVVNPDNIAKILDGNYDDGPGDVATSTKGETFIAADDPRFDALCELVHAEYGHRPEPAKVGPGGALGFSFRDDRIAAVARKSSKAA